MKAKEKKQIERININERGICYCPLNERVLSKDNTICYRCNGKVILKMKGGVK